MLGANIASLAFGDYKPFGGGFLGSPERVHHGWPLPWYGLAGLEVIAVPFTFSITTLFWSAITCTFYFLVMSQISKSSSGSIKYTIITLVLIVIIAISYITPYILGSISPF
jgi:hypothetical protein